MKDKKRVLLMGNPDTDKNAVFREITEIHKLTYAYKEKGYYSEAGEYYYKFNDYELINLPNTYSLFSFDKKSCLVRDYLSFVKYDCIICVVNSTSLFKGLIFALQMLEITDKAIIFLTFTNEARKKNILIDKEKLSVLLGVPVVYSTSKSGRGISNLLEEVHIMISGEKSLSKSLLCMCIPKGKEMLNSIDYNDENNINEIMLSVSAKATYAVSQAVVYLPPKRKRLLKAVKAIIHKKYILIPIVCVILSVLLGLVIMMLQK